MDLFAETRTAPTTATPTLRVVLRFAGSVAPIVACRIADQLATDRARRAVQPSSNLTSARANYAVRRNEISFFLGELVIRHGCNPFLPEKVAASITAHPLVAGGVALSM